MRRDIYIYIYIYIYTYIYIYEHIIPFYRDDVKSVDRIIFPPGSPIPPTIDENPTIPNDES